MNIALGIVVGSEERNELFINRCNSQRSVFIALSTWIDCLNQALPPPPEDPDMSKIRESHSPIVLGADTDTIGTVATIGSATVTELAEDVRGHTEASQKAYGHFAFSTALLEIVMGLAMDAHCEATGITAVTTASLDQVHHEVDAQVKLNNELHVKTVAVPPLSVLASKVMSTLDPSLLNTADLSCGAGRGEVALITVSERLAVL